MEEFRKLLRSIPQNKGKIGIFLVSVLVFLFMLFPFDDLGDLVSTQVSQLSNNSLYIQFQRLKVSLFPTPGLKMEKVFFESLSTPALTIEQLKITPTPSSLFYKKPYGYVGAQGILGGDLNLSFRPGPKSESGTEREKIEIQAEKISLFDLRKLGSWPLNLRGNLDLNLEAVADLAWKEAPEVEFNLKLDKLEIPPNSVNTALGPLMLPELKMRELRGQGRLSGGNLVVEKLTLGQDGDEIQGEIKGSLGVTLENRGGMPHPVIGSYSFDFNLKAKKSFLDKASSFLFMLDPYKNPTPDGAQYRFRLSGNGTFGVPSLSSLR